RTRSTWPPASRITTAAPTPMLAKKTNPHAAQLGRGRPPRIRRSRDAPQRGQNRQSSPSTDTAGPSGEAGFEDGERVAIRGAGGDEIGVREPELACDLAHGVVLLDRHVRVACRHGHAAVEQGELLLAGGRGCELARHEVVLGGAEERV